MLLVFNVFIAVAVMVYLVAIMVCGQLSWYRPHNRTRRLAITH